MWMRAPNIPRQTRNSLLKEALSKGVPQGTSMLTPTDSFHHRRMSATLRSAWLTRARIEGVKLVWDDRSQTVELMIPFFAATVSGYQMMGKIYSSLLEATLKSTFQISSRQRMQLGKVDLTRQMTHQESSSETLKTLSTRLFRRKMPLRITTAMPQVCKPLHRLLYGKKTQVARL